MTNTRPWFFKRIRVLHKWLGLILAIQLIFWIGGGLLMSSLPLEEVHGDHLAKRSLSGDLSTSAYLSSIDTLLAKHTNVPATVRFSTMLNQPTYELVFDDKVVIYNAQSGKKLAAPDKPTISQLANLHYLGEGQLNHVILLDRAPHEASGVNGQVWQANFDDSHNTSLYFSVENGRLLKVRSDLWRIFDFVWMLHIMDYDEREDFNNPLLVVFSSSALLFALSGVFMLWQSLVGKRFQRQRKQQRARV